MEAFSSADGHKKRLSKAQRQELLLQVAAEVFLEKGYEAASLDDIIRRAGGSRRNIYTQFGGKEGLFKSLIMQIASQALAPMKEHANEEGNLKAQLSSFAAGVMSILFSPAALGLSRIALFDGIRFPEIAEVYYASGPASAASSLAGLLEAARSRGAIQCPDCTMAANQFIGMLRDNRYLEVLLRLGDAPDDREKETLVKNAVHIFLEGLKPRDDINDCAPKPQVF